MSNKMQITGLIRDHYLGLTEKQPSDFLAAVEAYTDCLYDQHKGEYDHPLDGVVALRAAHEKMVDALDDAVKTLVEGSRFELKSK
jgi:hypothetical protein